MKLQAFYKKEDYFVKDDYEAIMFRFDSVQRKFFGRFMDRGYEVEYSEESKLLFDCLIRNEEIDREEYFDGIE